MAKSKFERAIDRAAKIVEAVASGESKALDAYRACDLAADAYNRDFSSDEIREAGWARLAEVRRSVAAAEEKGRSERAWRREVELHKLDRQQPRRAGARYVPGVGYSLDGRVVG